MLKLRNTLFSILVASNALIFAGTTGPICKPGDANCDIPAWEFGALALYLQPSYGGNGLGYDTFSNYGYDNLNQLVETNGATDFIHHVSPSQGWGFRIEGAKHINLNNDLSINWSHLDTKRQSYLPNGTLFAGSASGFYAGLIKLAPTWDTVNIEGGQSIHFTDSSHLRYHLGVEYARIKNAITNYPRLQPQSAPIFVTHDVTTFNGFGPRIGMDFTQNVVNNVAFYANAAASLLVGTAKQSVSGYLNFPAFFPGDTLNPYSDNNYLQKSPSVVIPELEAKLGATYHYALTNGKVKFDVGYMWLDYFNVIVRKVGAGVVSSAISISNTANFNLNGLYFGARWTGNVV